MRRGLLVSLALAFAFVGAAPARAGAERRHGKAAAAPAPKPSAPPPPAEPATRHASLVTSSPASGAPLELPRGGRSIFPEHRLVGFCGTPGAPALGKLSSTARLGQRAKEIEGFAEKYAKDKKVLPVFELIAVVVQGAPGADGKYRRRVPDAVVDDYLAAARAAKALLLLNVQPGHAAFLDEVKHFERWLKEPDVGVALDPEWAMRGKQKPGAIYGQTTGAVINEVSDYLSGIVRENALPEKVLVFHQVNGYVVKDEQVVAPYPGVAIVKGVDGLGPKGSKIATNAMLMKRITPGVRPGFKLFFDEDTRNGSRLMKPEEVLALTPVPDYVMYE